MSSVVAVPSVFPARVAIADVSETTPTVLRIFVVQLVYPLGCIPIILIREEITKHKADRTPTCTTNTATTSRREREREEIE